MENNMSNYIELSDYSYSHYIIMYKTLIIMNYICTFGLTEGMSPRMKCE
jgi:hypothetical protein